MGVVRIQRMSVRVTLETNKYDVEKTYELGDGDDDEEETLEAFFARIRDDMKGEL